MSKRISSSLKSRFLLVLIHVLTLHHVNSEEDRDTLKLVHVCFRHGNRTSAPISVYPNDPYKNETFYPYGFKELSEIGKENAYAFGEQLRERYGHFLNKTFFPPDVQTFTSNFSRTQMTLQAVLAGLYPPVWPYMAEPYLMWQPISYETLPSATDNLINVQGRNPDNFIHNETTELTQLYDYVSFHAGMKIRTSMEINEIYDKLLVDEQNGYPVPDWSKEIFYNGAMESAAYSYFTDLIEHHLDLFAGNLIKKITDDSIRKMNNDFASKIILYSGHDQNISILLGLFDAYSPANKFRINYVSHVIIELHQINDEYGFKVYFGNGPGQPLTQLKFKLCTGDFCSVDKFIESTKYVYTSQ